MNLEEPIENITNKCSTLISGIIINLEGKSLRMPMIGQSANRHSLNNY